MKFLKRGDRIVKQQSFDKEKIFITKAGQTYNVYDAIQAANVDTDIKEVLKKYHCTTDEAVEFMKSNGGMSGIYGKFAELQNQCQTLADVIALKDKADELFYNLPVEIRDKYGHDLNKFFEDLNKKAEENQKKQKIEEKKEVNNEQK